MLPVNTIDSDNKGFAGLVFEKAFDSSQYSAPGKKFVAAFATMEGGDSTPNVEGDLDGDGDWDCMANTNDGCIKYSGGLHATSALTLFASRGAPIQGPLDSVLHFIDMSQIEVTPEFSVKNEIQKTCQAALGVSMFAGIAPDHAGVGKEGVRCGEQRLSETCGVKPRRKKTVSLGSRPFAHPNHAARSTCVCGGSSRIHYDVREEDKERCAEYYGSAARGGAGTFSGLCKCLRWLRCDL